MGLRHSKFFIPSLHLYLILTSDPFVHQHKYRYDNCNKADQCEC